MLYARIPLVFFLCCIVCFFQRSCCELKTKLLTLMREGVPYKDVIECQNCILNVAGAMRANIYSKIIAVPRRKTYKNVMISVTYSEFSLIGIHSKCAMVGTCSEFDVKDPPQKVRNQYLYTPRSTNLNVIPDPNHLTKLKTTQEQETEERGPMCFRLLPMKATAQIRSCLKEVSGSNLIREYFVGFSDNQVMRSIIILYPQYNVDKPEEILLSCQHLDLEVDSSIYVHVDECQELSAGTSLVQPTPSTQMRADDNIPTSSHGTKVPSKFSGTPRCMYVVFESCGTAADCMTTFLRYVKGEAVFLHREKIREYYFYLFGSELAMDDLPGGTKLEMNFGISDVKCNEFLSHHYDTSESFQFQRSVWKPTKSEVSFSIQPLDQTHPQQIQSRDDEKRCVLAYEENIEKACLPCIEELKIEGGIKEMTGSTILLSGINDSNEAELATCITRPDKPQCSQFQFLPMPMCMNPNPSTFEKRSYGVDGLIHEEVTLVSWSELDTSCLVKFAEIHTVLLVSLKHKYVWVIPNAKWDEKVKMCGIERVIAHFDIEARYYRAISAKNMRQLIDQTIPQSSASS